MNAPIWDRRSRKIIERANRVAEETRRRREEQELRLSRVERQQEELRSAFSPLIDVVTDRRDDDEGIV